MDQSLLNTASLERIGPLSWESNPSQGDLYSQRGKVGEALSSSNWN